MFYRQKNIPFPIYVGPQNTRKSINSSKLKLLEVEIYTNAALWQNSIECLECNRMFLYMSHSKQDNEWLLSGNRTLQTSFWPYLKKQNGSRLLQFAIFDLIPWLPWLILLVRRYLNNRHFLFDQLLSHHLEIYYSYRNFCHLSP